MREVLLRLRTLHYERARDLLEALRQRSDRLLATARTTGEEVRRSAERAREAATDRVRAASAGRGSVRGGALDPLDEDPDFRRGLGRVGAVRGRVEAVSGAFTRGSLPGLMTALGPLLPGGALLTLLAPVTERLFQELERRFEAKLAARESAFLARLEEERFRGDYARRLAEDPAFAREQARLALELTLAEEAGRGRRVERSTAELVTDFGL